MAKVEIVVSADGSVAVAEFAKITSAIQRAHNATTGITKGWAEFDDSATRASRPVDDIISSLNILSRGDYEVQFRALADALAEIERQGITSGPVYDNLIKKLSDLEDRAAASGLKGAEAMEQLATRTARSVDGVAVPALGRSAKAGEILGPVIRKSADAASDALRKTSLEALGLSGSLGVTGDALTRIGFKAVEEQIESLGMGLATGSLKFSAFGAAGGLALSLLVGGLAGYGAALGVATTKIAEFFMQIDDGSEAEARSYEMTGRQVEQYREIAKAAGMSTTELRKYGGSLAEIISYADKNPGGIIADALEQITNRAPNAALAIGNVAAQAGMSQAELRALGPAIEEGLGRIPRISKSGIEAVQALMEASREAIDKVKRASAEALPDKGFFTQLTEYNNALRAVRPIQFDADIAALNMAWTNANTQLGSAVQATRLYKDEFIALGERAEDFGQKLDAATSSKVTAARVAEIVDAQKEMFPESIIQRAADLAKAYDVIVERTGSTKAAQAALKGEFEAVKEQGKQLGIVLPDAFVATSFAVLKLTTDANQLWGATEEGVARFKAAIKDAESAWPSFVASTQSAIDASVSKINELIAKQYQVSLGGSEDDQIVNVDKGDSDIASILDRVKGMKKSIDGAGADYVAEFLKGLSAGNITVAENILLALKDASAVINAHGGQAGGAGDKMAGLKMSLEQILAEFKQLVNAPSRKVGGNVTEGEFYQVHGLWQAPADGIITPAASMPKSSGFGGGNSGGFMSGRMEQLLEKNNALLVEQNRLLAQRQTLNVDGRMLAHTVNERNARGEGKRV